MKTKRIISLLTLALTMGFATSCADMLRTESKVVMFENENTLSSTADTVYSVMGIIQKMQVVADRTILLGEARADLVTPTEYINSDLLDIINYNVKSDDDNRYNKVVDYYSIINNCNYFLSRADTSYVVNDKKIFRREYVAVLGFRAWTYLQLAQIYGKVPFVTEPITSGDMADPSRYEMLDIVEIARRLKDDLKPYLEEQSPDYGTVANHNSTQFFIPTRLIYGDLCLWAGDYIEAAKSYHGFLSSTTNHVTTETTNSSWNNTDYVDDEISNSYSSLFIDDVNNPQIITYIPLEAEDYDGIVTNLLDIFNSTEDNYYYPQLSYSKALVELSASQQYCYHDINPNTNVSTYRFPADNVKQQDRLYDGDLRLPSIVNRRFVKLDETMGRYNDEMQTIRKFYEQKICIYRNDQVYLRLAEAMNRAGMPEMAFMVLKYGLCEENIVKYLSNEERSYIAQNGLEDLLFYSVAYFRPAEYGYAQGARRPNYQQTVVYNTIGLHSRGSGNATVNERYVLPTDTTSADYLAVVGDSAAMANYQREYRIGKVEEMIADEMALETCFEGYRFGDLMRIAIHRAEETGGYADNEYLASKVAMRNGQLDQELFNRLKGDGTSYNQNWFLPLP